MKWRLLSFVAIALFSSVACSRSRSPEAVPSAPSPQAAASPGRSRDPAQEELDKLQGTWQVVSSTWNGVPDPAAAKTITIIFQSDKFIVVDKDGNRQEETIKLMPDQNPKAIDCWSKGGGQ